MKKKSDYYKYLTLLVLIMFISLVIAIPLITQISPVGDITTSNSSIEISFNITQDDNLFPTNLTWSWDNVNYTLWNGLVLYFNMDNRSELGENSTYVYDISGNNNNGTVNNMTWESDSSLARNGNGGFRFGRNTSAGVSKYISRTQVITNTSNFTASIWIKPSAYTYNDDAYIVRLVGTYGILLRYDDNLGAGNQKCYVTIYNGSDLDTTDSRYPKEYIKSHTNNCQKYSWHNMIVTYNTLNNNISLYVDGILYSRGTFSNTLVGATTTMYIGSAGDYYSTLEYLYFNGSIDDLMIFNRTLSASEISQLYYSQLTKYNSQNWTFWTNQSNLLDSTKINSTNPTYNYSYYLCSSNSTAETCSTQKTITQTIPNQVLTANFSNSIGNVHSLFYGVGVQSPTKLVGTRTLDTNCDGVGDTNSNITWQRENMLASGSKINYYDASLGGYYNGVENPSFEFWANSTLKNVSTESPEKRVYGWNFGSVGSANSAWVSNSTDAHSGLYSLNITGNSGTNFAFVSSFQSANFNLTFGDNYTIGMWVKGSGTFRFFIQEVGGSYLSCNTSSFTATNSWVQYNTTCNNLQNLSATPYLYRISIDYINSTEWFLFDDFSFYKNGQPYNWWRIGNTSAFENTIDWEYANGIKTMMILDYMPEFLTNRTSQCVDNESDSDYSDCMAYNETIFADISLDWYKRVTRENTTLQNNTYVQIWNEPYGGYFEDNLASDSAKMDFVTLFNSTYNTFKNYNSNIEIWGYRDNTYSTLSITSFTKMMLSNLSSQFKNYDFHPYRTNMITGTKLSSSINYLLTQCAVYGAECSHISASEWQPTSYTLKNQSNGTSDEYKANIAYVYWDVLNTYPNMTTLMPFHWDDSNSYFNCPSRYSEYPAFWSSVSEKGLDNATDPVYYPIYTVPQKYSNLCPAGATVYTSSSDDSNIKTVTCKKGNSYSVIVINTGTTSKNNTLNSFPSTIRNLETGITLTSNLGILDSYGINYLGNGVYGDNANTGIYFNKHSLKIKDTDYSDYSLLTNENNISDGTEIYGLTNALVYNSNGTVYGNSNINSNDNNVNFSFSPNNLTYVLDNFNLTEGTTRTNSPLWFSSSTSTVKNIASNLTNSINTTLIIPVGSCQIDSISLTPKDESSYNPSYSCSSNTLTINNAKINPSSSSNVLNIVYTTFSGGSSSFTYIYCYKIDNNKCIEQGFFTSCILPYYPTMSDCERALNLSLTNITNQTNINQTNIPSPTSTETFWDTLKRNIDYLLSLNLIYLLLGAGIFLLILYFLNKR